MVHVTTTLHAFSTCIGIRFVLEARDCSIVEVSGVPRCGPHALWGCLVQSKCT